ncbi:MAG TPA: glycoside hydrolase family 15 protein, partial [Candidatus Acidoferrum sp.]|nr:glycoside hydrolase family 15 protein [Candidatus Acidoferrum sp.]
MSRPIVLSNGSLHVGINSFGMVHDFYYPHVGQENHAVAGNMRWRVGVWVQDQFSWLDSGEWQFTFDYTQDAMVGHATAFNPRLNIKLEFKDCVDYELDVFMRRIQVTNAIDERREIRLFLHQVVRINNSLNGDTAQFLPSDNAILHYKGNRVFVFGAVDEHNIPFKQYAIGIYGIEGLDGTFRDAEDGMLSGNAVEHGSVDSIVGFDLHLAGQEAAAVSYWVAAATEHFEAIRTFKRIRVDGIESHINRTIEYWQRWLRPANTFVESIDPALREPVKKSLLIIKAHMDKHGALIASTDTTMRNYSRDTYAYCWPRDGAYGVWPLLRLGYFSEVLKFFHFCRQSLQPEGFLMHKYQADGAVGSSWHPYVAAGRTIPPIQEDETAIVVFLFGQYYQITEDKEMLNVFYDSLIRPAANFMAGYIDEFTKLPHASYDIWEEKLLTTTYTTAVTYAALGAAARLADAIGRQHEAVQWQSVADDIRLAAPAQLFSKEKKFFLKGFIRERRDNGSIETIYNNTIDMSSFYGAFMFGLFDVNSDEIKQAFQTLVETFGLQENAATPVPRYVGDVYRRNNISDPSNPWFITTLWLAQYYLEIKQPDKAKAIIELVRQHMM